MADVIQHDTAGSRYVLLRDGREIGETVYETASDGTMNFVHTEVDETVQEHGLGSKLVRAALDDVRGMSSVRVSASCPFVSAFLRAHPDYHDLTTR
ncbi:MAG: N-acetyltransferase [Leifsonia sp.]|nr:N-acetyltransferase [Leifsonia sp.]